MATVRDSSNHDPGDEHVTRYREYDNEDCPFCDLKLRLSQSWCTPVLSHDYYSARFYAEPLSPSRGPCAETITTCADPKCRAKAGLLAARLAIPADERAMRRRHAYYMKTGEKIR